jgi:hypothetical protein
MTRASNAAIKGKGGLAAPQIALTLGVVGFLQTLWQPLQQVWDTLQCQKFFVGQKF